MGKLVDGKWVKQSVITSDNDGSYDRIPRNFLSTISKDSDRFAPDEDRYHLYVSFACPWAHRTLIFRKLKNLEDIIDVSVVSPEMLENGWSFSEDFPETTGDKLYGKKYLKEIYTLADNNVSTSVTVPVLWDKKHKTIVNNESSEIIRIFNTAFNDLTGNEKDYYPVDHKDDIDQWNDYIYEHVNNGVYKAGFAKNQKVYEQAVIPLFNALDKLESHLENKSFLVGNTLTEADVRFITTLLRFDSVYYSHFKCNKKRIKDYKNLSKYCEELFSLDAIKDTTNIEHIKHHYYYSHKEINPTQIIPVGPNSMF